MAPSLKGAIVEKQVKVVVLGDISTGKSCLCARFCNDEFTRQYYPTSGVDFFLKRIHIQDHVIKLLIWDVSGAAMNSPMITNYVYNAHIILFVYDITSLSSFVSVRQWYDTVAKVQARARPTELALVGNKSDMEHQRSVPLNKHAKFASDIGFSSHIVSARTGENVIGCFQRVCANCLNIKLTRNELEERTQVIKAEIVTSNQSNAIQVSTTTSSACVLQ
ncbi:unnamed protein product [Bemisia tabaci]|uniref:Ras-related protein Rab-28 n=1 Tax=Bemisia tabaci TaxID=7038 RepID=A0A9P0AKE3_BEMTA|nr:PREDICTED: ras-related protein Rab-28-like [Bemisia tabaci]CAH0394699.1 unnamed protein product [Bemisia tabaci]